MKLKRSLLKQQNWSKRVKRRLIIMFQGWLKLNQKSMLELKLEKKAGTATMVIMDGVSNLIQRKTKSWRKLKMKIIIQFITIWSNDSLEVLLKTKINTKKCGKITTHKLQMDIIIKITMDMQDMKVLTKHGVTQHTLIITIIMLA